MATTRPETLFGDVAVAVNPNDHRYFWFLCCLNKLFFGYWIAEFRYKHLHGKCALNPFTNELMPIILEANVDQNFGTGK